MSDETIDPRAVEDDLVADEPTVVTPPARVLAALPARVLAAVTDAMRIYPPS